jgi:uncharacterized protein
MESVPVLLPGLLTGIVALALAGLAHCSAMCGLPCAVILGRRPAATGVAFHTARAISYAAAGAVLAGGIAHVGEAAGASRALRPLWTLWHVAGLAWGSWMLIHARQPAWLERWLPAGPRPAAGTQTVSLVAAGASPTAAIPSPKPWADIGAAAAAGLAWAAWPCGLLHSALMMASLSGSAAGGAVAMSIFAVISGAGLVVAPRLWRSVGEPGVAARITRLAGLMLMLSCLWALADHSGFVAWCLSHA